MDCRVKPGNDGGETVAANLRTFERKPLLADDRTHTAAAERQRTVRHPHNTASAPITATSSAP
jgi:hypothetical protein